MEDSLQQARKSLQSAKQQARDAINKIHKETISATAISLSNVNQSMLLGTTENKSPSSYSSSPISYTQSSALSFDDVDYMSSEMAPPFLDEDQCLIPGEPIVRVEKAPENSRRIFAGIDIMASVDDVWNVLTDYNNLQNVVPNLVVNEVLELYNYDQTNDTQDVLSDDLLAVAPEEEQCRMMCEKMKGSKLRQVGGAKVAGIQFSARTTLEVREWPNGMPDFAHFCTGLSQHPSNMDGRNKRAKEFMKIPLQRYKFPRPFAISSLPTKDISMQSVLNDDGEFRIYQGVWRMQPLPGCAPPGSSAMRLTYAVQISPRSYLPVALIENRIVRDLCTNLIAIRNYVCH
jgi:Polyketide cyclase / dehydrase and lipid transport